MSMPVVRGRAEGITLRVFSDSGRTADDQMHDESELFEMCWCNVHVKPRDLYPVTAPKLSPK